jgi:hypothetical protein
VSVEDSKCHRDIDAAQPEALSLFTPRIRDQSILAVAVDKRSAWTAMREGAIVDAAGTMDAGVGSESLMMMSSLGG